MLRRPTNQKLQLRYTLSPLDKPNAAHYLLQSVVTLEVKPWDDETDMAKLEESVRSIEQEGLVWGASKLVAVGFGIKKLQITLVVGLSSRVFYSL
jgi:elongation factor 1-beta